MSSNFARARRETREAVHAQRSQLPTHHAIAGPPTPTPCKACKGRGTQVTQSFLGAREMTCSACRGRAIETDPLHDMGEAAAMMFGHWPRITCPACQGRGRRQQTAGLFMTSRMCIGCIGRGFQHYPHTQILIPATGLLDAHEGARTLN